MELVNTKDGYNFKILKDKTLAITGPPHLKYF